MSLLSSKDDFKWYKLELDVHQRYSHDHIGEPTSYPCEVSSVFSDPSNGPYTYKHTFKYPVKVPCSACGQIEVVYQ